MAKSEIRIQENISRYVYAVCPHCATKHQLTWEEFSGYEVQELEYTCEDCFENFPVTLFRP